MKPGFAVLLALVAGCAPTRTTTLVLDPWQVAVVHVTKRGDVPYVIEPRNGQPAPRCEWRDEAGFPHFCDRGDFMIAHGRFITPDALRDGPNVRLTAHLLRIGWCRKTRRRCWLPGPALAFITPARNVISIERAPVLEVPLPPVVGSSP